MTDWISHNVGGCPVGHHVNVIVKYGSGERKTGMAGFFDWTIAGGKCGAVADIVEYQIVDAAPASTDWIEWNGGECPVAKEMLVDVKFRPFAKEHPDSASASSQTARHLRWDHDSSPGDIVAYRIVDAPGASTGGWIEWRGGQSPVDDDVKVDARFRRGNVVSNMEAGYWNWEHPCHDDDDSSDVVAYRLAVPSELPKGNRDETPKSLPAWPSALAIQVGGDHYKGAAIQPVEFCVKNKMESLESNIVKRAFRHDKPTGKGREDVEKIIHEAQLLLELKYGVAA